MLKRLAKAEIEGKSLEAFKHALAMASISAAQDLAFSLANLQVMLAAIESVQKPQIRNGNPMQSPLARCLNHIEANLNRQLSLAELAKHSYVCSSRLMQLFKAKLGETPIQYISRRRAALAEQMIQEENRTVSEVASLLDFHSLSYFTRFFKKQTGRNPSKLRHESRNTI